MADQRVQYTEEMVGAGHPTKADTLNRLMLVEHGTDGTHGGAIGNAGAEHNTDGTHKSTNVYTDLITKGPWIDVRAYGAKGDGVTDDTAALNSALAAAAGKGICYIPNTGNYYVISSQLNIYSNTHVKLDGNIILGWYSNCSMVFINGASNVVIEGRGFLHGNSPWQTVIAIGGIYVNNSSNVTIRDINIGYIKSWPVNTVGSSDVFVENCTMYGSGNSCEFAAGSANCWFIGNMVYDINDEGIAFYGGVFRSGAIGNIVANSTAGSGISILNDSAQSAACHDIVISDNILYNNHYSGIEANSGIGTLNYNIGIHNNLCLYNNKGNIGGQGGIHIGDAYLVNISDNMIHHDGAGANASYGIRVSGGSSSVMITGNQIGDEGQGGTLGVGVNLESASYILITGNRFYDSQAAKTTAYHVNGTGSYIVVRDNFFDAPIGAKINVSGTYCIFEDNLGVNPVGPVSAPAVPASGAALTNPRPYACRVFINGGTISDVAINGTSTGGTPRAVVLGAGESITMTYSAAPAWTWFGM
ncbi:MAG: right-handed parallel beta-helix repeat-containing protein [Deltaproteobacteria bacterium]|nr:right-handed parallel beta-helix repeat-containing protein [Deltaproteobacteria bacterium]